MESTHPTHFSPSRVRPNNLSIIRSSAKMFLIIAGLARLEECVGRMISPYYPKGTNNNKNDEPRRR
jgi:hypothetical protein